MCSLLIVLLLVSAPFARAQTPKPAEASKAPAAPKPGDPPKTFDVKAIDAYVAARVREQGFPGLSLTIVREGKVVLAKGYGERSLEDEVPVEPQYGVRRRLGDQAVHLRLHPPAGRGRQAVGRRQGGEVLSQPDPCLAISRSTT